ncbi:MAG: Ribosomal large subunit pseudouridine synthase D [Chlamydiales bacterium]|nr:Ribosomal large subunit pseudouridine synthase D [Chlamydiales bacterium]MCH9620487.1 Ribosomal large subunit pseudouridine synthase D [Chlamydiales bacterium]MCH9623472.1 Ribosomal large subunit pseudouridine synthase D [Chlamydiales bacterium]
MKVKFKVVTPSKLLPYLRDELRGEWKTKPLRWLIEHHRCHVNGFVERFCSTRLRKGDEVEIFLEEPPSSEIPILFEDDELIVINKPVALTSENIAETLGGLLVHRLDRDTTGVMLLAKTDVMKEKLEKLFKRREVKKSYLTYVTPPPKKRRGVINTPVGGKEAVTSWNLVKRFKKRALLRCSPKTGRTHQIRIHLQSVNTPIEGDVDYGGRHQTTHRPLLHAEKISFESRSFSAPLPQDMELK